MPLQNLILNILLGKHWQNHLSPEDRGSHNPVNNSRKTPIKITFTSLNYHKHRTTTKIFVLLITSIFSPIVRLI